MNKKTLLNIFSAIQKGTITPDEALNKFSTYPFEDLDFVKIDHHRSIRKGFPEVVFGQNKKPSQIMEILSRLSLHEETVMATRIAPEVYSELKKSLPELIYYEDARIVVLQKGKSEEKTGFVVVLSAGTSDIPVAEEASVTAQLMGNKVIKHYDVGVAGIHRLFDKAADLLKARVLVVVAGMEGALPSVVAGLVSAPVIAVPTSIGYGASFSGLAPLLTMMNSCASGVAVVNIDNGFNAGYLASLINKTAHS